MFELEKTERIKRLIAVTKSNSGISGPELALAHMELGKAMGEQMNMFDPADTTIIAMLRGGGYSLQRGYISR